MHNSTEQIAEEELAEGEKQIDRRERNNVTQIKIRSNCSEEFS